MTRKQPSSAQVKEIVVAGCEQTRRDLPAYATAVARAWQVKHLYPEVAAHLEQCVTCGEELDELCALTSAAYSGTITPTPVYPSANLSFLRTVAPARPPATSPWYINQLGDLIITFSQAFIDALRQPSLVRASRGQRLYGYTLDQGELPKCNVVIEVMHAEEAFGRVQVGVESLVHDPFDQPPHHVVITADGMIWEGNTDAVGTIVFERVPLVVLPHLQFVITPHPILQTI